MKLAKQSSLSLRLTLRYVEWTLLLIGTATQLLSGRFYNIPRLLYIFIGFNIVFFVLSFICPIDRPAWQRRGYVGLEIFLIIAARLMGIPFTILLYFFLAKTCIFLNRKEVIFTVVFAGIAYILALAWDMPWLIQRVFERIKIRGLAAEHNPRVILLSTLLEYIGVSTFVILLGFVIVSERKSRQRAEILAKEVETLAATLERTRIAREIHDSLGHNLTTLDVQLELAQRLRSIDSKKALEVLDTAKTLSSECLQDVRRAVQTIRLQDFNLNKALTILVDQVQQNQIFTIELNISLPILPLQTSHQIYCIIQEGFTNIQKHANAKNVSLTSEKKSDGVILELTDDGCGFDVNAPHTGFGIRGMYERMQILGGDLKIKSASDSGTQITIFIPSNGC
ncbi:MAG: sensor histidine kinase [Scytonematopsis contorta HA4267-MV1]|jgi:signal transduction histidine kinase|nr:sensor histidine kinase [Scytonematopsis contorta HA4267-MV1]